MADHFGMAQQLLGQTLRFGWYLGLTRWMERQALGLASAPKYKPTRPVPAMRALMGDVGTQMLRDALAVRDGIYPPMEDEAADPFEYLARVRAMLADLPDAIRRRKGGDVTGARARPGAKGLPDYFTQDFHYQDGGYLSTESARLYDVQLETLFMGAGAPMRREALRPIAEYMRGRDQRRVMLLDVACGTGRFLRNARRAWPALGLVGIDLSRPYLDEARAHLRGLRPVHWITANAEAMPLPDASVDVATCIFLFHELPSEVRRRIAGETARVLKPGGILVFIDSLQMGDRPDWDGLLEAFPMRFHEPYFRHYTIDDLDGLFTQNGLAPLLSSIAFLSKVMVRQKK